MVTRGGGIFNGLENPGQDDSDDWVEALYAAGYSMPKVHCGHEFRGVSSYNEAEITEKVSQHADCEMVFPGIADDTLFEVYLANRGDWDLTIDMFNHLELSVGCPQKLLDVLDIAD